ncbi:MAG: phosphatidate cytidylyltransferase [Saprospiraceae bacterium]|nr:phosphatidate cytidylyltransferase [Bacteroidia bacterium]NNE16298.1 phosphatidate cytidylyltransferase [Saprospiraceae bacterium]NNL93335.1 phosphatidate cytidylyltransferase [Saprospiraceae bacterium]
MASGLKQRIQTAIIIGIPILFLVFFNDTTRLVFISLIAVLASFEFIQLNYTSLKQSAVGMISFLLGIILIAATFFLVIPITILLAVSLILNLTLIYDLYHREKSFLSESPWFWNIGYVILPFILLLIFKSSTYFSQIVISTLLLIWISDISAYFVGKSTGKRKLFPKVSPGKTWEGFLGAGLTTVIFSYFFFSYFKSFNLQVWALIGLSAWLFGSIGDLVESKFKRIKDIKDSGQILPGHGGFLDRFDGFIFCIPFILVIIYIFETYKF